MLPLISIIVPVYNVEKYLEECLNSIISQTYTNLEIILVDDGSTDGSSYICDKYSAMDPRIIVCHQNNKGLSAARNIGLLKAKGEFIGFIDSDDWIEKDMYESLYKSISSNNSDISGCSFVEETALFPRLVGVSSDQIMSPQQAMKLLLTDKGITNNVWNKLYRSKLFDNISFPDGKVYEDVATLYKLILKAKKLSIISKAGYHYRINPNGIMRSNNISYQFDFWNAALDRYINVSYVFPELHDLLLIDCLHAVIGIWSHIYDNESFYDKVYFKKLANFSKVNYNKILKYGTVGMTAILRGFLTRYNSQFSFVICKILKKVSDMKHK